MLFTNFPSEIATAVRWFRLQLKIGLVIYSRCLWQNLNVIRSFTLALKLTRIKQSVASTYRSTGTRMLQGSGSHLHTVLPASRPRWHSRHNISRSWYSTYRPRGSSASVVCNSAHHWAGSTRQRGGLASGRASGRKRSAPKPPGMKNQVMGWMCPARLTVLKS